MRTSKAVSLANHEIVTLAVFLLRGDTRRVDTEDIAVKANELAHGRFTWRKYPDQINIDAVRKRLWECRETRERWLSGLGWRRNSHVGTNRIAVWDDPRARPADHPARFSSHLHIICTKNCVLPYDFKLLHLWSGSPCPERTVEHLLLHNT